MLYRCLFQAALLNHNKKGGAFLTNTKMQSYGYINI